MVAMVSGNSLGLELNSGSVLGARGVFGNGTFGQGQFAAVNLATGNLVLQNRDDSLAAIGPDITALRTYNSQGFTDGDNNDGWRLGLVRSVDLSGSANAAGSIIDRTGPDGSVSRYQFDTATRRYLNRDAGGAADVIVFNTSSQTIVRTDGDTGVSETYTLAPQRGMRGMLLSIADLDGNTLTWSYNNQRMVTRIDSNRGAPSTGATREAMLFSYTPDKNLESISTLVYDTNGARRTVSRVDYVYAKGGNLPGPAHRLIQVRVDLTPLGGPAQSYVTDYHFVGNSKLVNSITTSDGYGLSIEYATVGGVDRVARTIDGLGRVTRYDYDLARRLTTVTDPLGLRTLYEYDTAGQLVQITGPAVDGVSAVRRFAYNANGDVVRTTDGEDNAIEYGYDANDNQVLQRDALGNTVRRVFDADNQLLSETLFAVPDPDGAGPAQPGQPQTTRYVYDGSRRKHLRFVISAEGRVTEYRYDSFGQRVATLQYTADRFLATEQPTEATLAAWAARAAANGAMRTDARYDFRGQLASTTRYARLDAAGNGMVDGSETTLQYVYGPDGTLQKTISGEGGITLFAYDGLNRVIASTDALGQVTTTRYDDAGNRTSVTAANGLQTLSSYDRVGQLIATTRIDSSGLRLGETLRTYDADGRLRMVQDPTGVRTWMFYDAAGRKVADLDGDGSLTEYRYDREDRLVQTIARARRVDPARLGSALTVDTPLSALRPADDSGDRSTRRWYDAAGRLWLEVDARGAVRETRYDGAGRVLATIAYASLIPTAGLTADRAPALPQASMDDRIVRRVYDADGLLRGEVDGEGALTEYRYDAAGREVARITYAQTTAFAVRASGRIEDLIPPTQPGDIITRRFYDAEGRLIGEVDGEGYLTETRYDRDGRRVLSLRHALPVNGPVTANSTLDALRPVAHGDDQQARFSWDLLGRLVLETDASGTQTRHEYDSAGNEVRTTRAFGDSDARATLARYDIQGRVTAELDANGAVLLAALAGANPAGTSGAAAVTATSAAIEAIWSSHSLRHTYDSAGRRTSTTDALGHRTVFYYDADGRLVLTIDALGQATRNVYDALGQRTATTRHANVLANPADLAGGLISATLAARIDALRDPGRDSTETWDYDVAGAVRRAFDPLGQSRLFETNAFGEQSAVLTGLANLPGGSGVLREESFYDRRGLVVATRRSGPSANVGLNPSTRPGTSPGALPPGATSSALSAMDVVTTVSIRDAFGRVIASVDGNGNRRIASYDRLGRMVAQSDASGNSSTTTWDAFGRELTRTDAMGNTTRYRNDVANRTQQVTMPDGTVVTTVFNRHGQVQSVTDGRGNTTSWRYDRNGNLLDTTAPLARTSARYDAANRLIETTDANGVRTVLEYEAVDRVLSRTVDPGGLALVTRTAWDAQGRAIRTVDANGVVTVNSFDRKGQMVRQMRDPGGLNLTTLWRYDERGIVVAIVDPRGIETRIEFDALGRRVAEHRDPTGLDLVTRWAYDANDNVIARTDANGAVTRFEYDPENRLIRETDVLGQTTTQVWDANGRLMTRIQHARLSNPSDPSTPGLVLSPDDVFEQRVYDAMGRLAWEIDGAGGITRRSYDANGNAVSETRYATPWQRAAASIIPPTETTLLRWAAQAADPARDASVRRVFDAANRVTHELDGTGALTRSFYDGNGNLVDRLRVAAALTLTDAGVATLDRAGLLAALPRLADPVHDARERNLYDAANRLVVQVDGQGGVRCWAYDANGAVIEAVQHARAGNNLALDNRTALATQLAALADPARDAQTWTVRDAAGRIIYVVDGVGAVTRRSYDGVGNLLEETGYANALDAVRLTALRGLSGAATNEAQLRWQALLDAAVPTLSDPAHDQRVRRVYDDVGRVVRSIDGVGAVTLFTYDARGNLTERLQCATTVGRDAELGAIVPSADDRRTRFGYDGADRLVWQIDGRGSVQRWLRDGLGQVVQSTAHANRLAAGAGIDAVQADAARDKVVRNTYDAAGRVVRQMEGNGATTRTQYDALGHVLALTRQANEGANAHATAITAATAFTPDPGRTTLQSWDAAGRLLLVRDAVGAVTRNRFDALGRLLESTRSAQTVALGLAAGDIPTVLTADADDQTTRHDYDAAGNRIRTTDVEGGVLTYGWDALGRMTSSTGRDQVVTRMEYDAAGRVVRTIAPGVDKLVTTNTWDALGRLRAVTQEGRAAAADSGTNSGADSGTGGANVAPADPATRATRITRYDVDARGLRVRSTGPAPDGDAGNAGAAFTNGPIALSLYNAFGEQIASTDPLGKTSLRTWDQAGNLVELRDPTGQRITRAYDAFGAQIAETVWLSDTAGLTSWRVFDTRVAGSAAGPRFEISPEGRVVEHLYNPYGERIATLRYSGNVFDANVAGAGTTPTLAQLEAWAANADRSAIERTDFSRDARGLLVATTTHATLDARGLDPSASAVAITRTRYDVFGRLVDTTDALGAHRGTRYDRIDRTIASTDALGQETRTVWDDQNHRRTITQPDGLVVTEQYDAAGHLLSVSRSDRAGLVLGVTTYQYDRLGRQTQVRDPSGLTRTTLYDALDRRIADIDADGSLTEYRYDLSGRLTRTIAWVRRIDLSGQGGQAGQSLLASLARGATLVTLDGLRPAADPDDRSSWRGYDAAGRLVAEVDASGAVTETVYDAAGRIDHIIRHATRITLAGLPDVLDMADMADVADTARVIPPASADDRITRNDYDHDGLLIGSVDGEGTLTEYRYDAAGREVERIRRATTVSPAAASSAAQGSAAAGTPVVASHADDQHSLRAWDDRGQLIAELDAEGYLTRHTYDALGQRVQTVRYAARPTVPSGQDLTTWAAAGFTGLPEPGEADDVERRAWDAQGRLVLEVDRHGTETRHEYDAAGRRTRSVRAAGTDEARAQSWRYDLQGNLIGESRGGSAAVTAGAVTGTTAGANVDNPASTTGSTNARTTGSANASSVAGTSAGTVPADNFETRYTVDAAGRRISLTDAAGHRTVFYYDDDGRRAWTINALGEVRAERYDGLNQLVGTVDYATRLTGLAGLTGGLLRDHADVARQLAALATSATSATPATSATDGDRLTSWRYDATGRIANHTDARGAATLYEYNAFGEEIACSKPQDQDRSTVERYAYDHRGARIATQSDADGPNPLAIPTSQSFDAFGRLVDSIDANGRHTHRAWDRLGRQVLIADDATGTRTTTWDAFDRVLSQTDALGHTTTTTWSDTARSMTVISAEGLVSTTVRNRHGETSLVIDAAGQAREYVYDARGNLVRTLASTGNTEDVFDALDQRIEHIDARGVSTRFSFDAAGRMLTRVVDPDGLALTTRMVFDAFGQAVRTTDPRGVVTATRYDAVGHAVEVVQDPDGLHRVTRTRYDLSGRRVSVTDSMGVETVHAYDALGRRVASRVDPAGLNLVSTWRYDAAGNVIASTDAADMVTRHVYDAGNRLAYSVDQLGNVVELRHDAAGRLIDTVRYAQALSGAVLAELFGADPAPDGTTPPENAVRHGTLQPTAGQLAARLVTSTNDQHERRVYDDDGRLHLTIDGAGGVRAMRVDGVGNVIEEIGYATALPVPGAAGVTGATGMSGTSGVNGAGGASESNAAAGSSAVTSPPATAEYGPWGDRAAVLAAVAALPRSGADQVTRRIFDGAGRVVWQQDGTGAVVRNLLDGNGNVVARIAYATPIPLDVNLRDLPLFVTSGSDDRITRYGYDQANRLVLRIDADGAVTRQTLDANGNLVQRVSFANPLAPVRGDDPALSDLLQATELSRLPALLSRLDQRADPAHDRVLRQAYDSANRQVFAIDAEGGVTESVFDAEGRVIIRRAYANPVGALNVLNVPTAATGATGAAGSAAPAAPQPGSPTSSAYAVLDADAIRARLQSFDTTDRIARTVYDHAGRITLDVDALGQATGYRVDGVGRVFATTRYANPLAATDLAQADRLRDTGVLLARLRPDLANDRTTRIDYDANGRVIATTDALGQRESGVYDGAGNRIAFTNKAGATWHYGFDAAGRLTSESSPPVLLAGTQVDDRGILTESPPTPAPVVTLTDYDALGNVVARTEAAGRPEARTTRYRFDAAGHQIGISYPSTRIQIAHDDLTAPVLADHDARHEIEVPLEVATRYDAFGNAIANRDVTGAFSVRQYDRMGRVTRTIDALGYVTETTWSAFGEATQLTRRAISVAPSAEGLTTEADAAAARDQGAPASPDDRTIITEYDRLGRVVRITEPAVFAHDSSATFGGEDFVAGKVTRKHYNRFGEIERQAELRNPRSDSWIVTTHWYDQLGRELASVDALGYLTTRAWDADGHEVAHAEYARAIAGWNARPDDSGSGLQGATWPVPASDPDDRITLTTYDALGRKTSETRVGVEVANAGANARVRADLTERWRYDAVGNVVSDTDASGAITRTWYDAQGRVSAVAEPQRTALTPLGPLGPLGPTPMSPLTTFLRDAHGNVVVETRHARAALNLSDPTETAVAPIPQSDAADRRTVHVYDANGWLLQTRDAEGVDHFMTRTARGQVAKEWQGVTRGDGTLATPFVLHEYDALGREILQYLPSVDPNGGRALAASGGYPTSGNGGNDGSNVDAIAAALRGRWRAPTRSGVTSREIEYNAFGEAVVRGTDGGRQEFFDYDRAGRVWRTNSGDGVVKVNLLDLQGRITAEIRSDGSVDLGSLANPAQAAAVSSGARRVETRYDALGHAVARFDASPGTVQAQGGVSVHGMRVDANIIGSAVPSAVIGAADTSTASPGVPAGSTMPVIRWSDSNRLDLSWDNLSSLGGGDLLVEVDYLTQGYTLAQAADAGAGSGIGTSVNPALLDPDTPPPPGERVVPAELITLRQAFTAGTVATGAHLEWTDAADAPRGGISAVRGVRVWKQDRSGLWQLVLDLDQAARDTGVIDIAAPIDPGVSVRLEVRAAPDASDASGAPDPDSGSGSLTPADDAWQTQTLVDFGSVLRFDPSRLGAGNWQYRVLSTAPGAAPQVTSSGRFTLGAVPAAIEVTVESNSTTGTGTGPSTGNGTDPSTRLTWTTPPAGTQQQFRYRLVGSSDAWAPLVVQPVQSVQSAQSNAGARSQVTWPAGVSGRFEYELTWTRPDAPGDSDARAAGELSLQAQRPAVWQAAQGVPVIDGLALKQGLTGGTQGTVRDRDVFLWPAPEDGWVQEFRWRPAGGNNSGDDSSWTSLPILDLRDGDTRWSGVDRQAISEVRFEYSLRISRPDESTASEFGATVDLTNPILPSGQLVRLRDADGAPLGGTPTEVFRWPAPHSSLASVFSVRPAGRPDAAWRTLPVEADHIGIDADGKWIGSDQVDVSGLAAGEYEVRLAFVDADPATGTASSTSNVSGARAQATGDLRVVAVEVRDPAALPHTELRYFFDLTTPVYAPALVAPGTPAAAMLHPFVNSATLGLHPETDSATRVLGALVQFRTDRWGNVLESSDVRSTNWKTRYRYDANDQLIEAVRPDDAGGLSANSPVTQVYRDALGRVVGQRDARGNLQVSVLNAAGQVVEERHADGGVVRHAYDAFGERVRTTDPLGNATQYARDRMGRLVQVTSAPVATYTVNGANQLVSLGYAPLVTRHEYDTAGREIATTDGSGAVTRYRYDDAGNRIATIRPLGQTTQNAWDDLGRKILEIDGNGNAAAWSYDHFGRLMGHSDIGGAVYNYRYDVAGQLVATGNTRGQDIVNRYDQQGRLVEISDRATGKTTTYAYDAAGRHIRERTEQGGAVYQDNVLSWDTLGRLKEVSDPWTRVSIDYDAAGNRTHVRTTSIIGDPAGNLDRWYVYDSMNRQVVVDGVDAAGNLGAQGQRVGYDLAGNRVSVTRQGNVLDGGGNVSRGEVHEVYGYDALGRLVMVDRNGLRIDQRYYDGAHRAVQSGPNGAISQATADKLNQNVPERERLGNETHLRRYDANGNLLFDHVLRADNGAKMDIAYLPYDGAGNATGYSITNLDGDRYTNTFRTTYALFETYKEARVDGSSDRLRPGATLSSYDVNGFLTAVQDSTKGANNRSFVNDAQGRILFADQGGNVQRQLIANGEVLGQHGVTLDRVQARASNGDPRFAPLTDLNFTFAPVANGTPAPTPSSRTVATGETLQSIARSAYGDADLWYLIANANGVTRNEELRAGQVLTIPGVAGTVHNQADTFRVFEPGRMVGDTTPNLPPPPPPPPPKKGCGVLAIIVIVVVAVAVTIATAGAGAALAGATVTTAAGTTVATGSVGVFAAGSAVLAGATSLGIGAAFAVGAVAAAAGSIASQLVGMAMGVQYSFSWSQVGVSALTGGIGAGVGSAAQGTWLSGRSWDTLAVKATLSNAASQGVAVATGLQDQFSWSGVAASALGASVGSWVNSGLTSVSWTDGVGATGSDWFSGGTAIDLLRATTVGVVASSTATLLTHGRVELERIAADAFGNALASSFTNRLAANGMQRGMEEQARMEAAAQSGTNGPASPAAGGDDTASAYGDTTDLPPSGASGNASGNAEADWTELTPRQPETYTVRKGDNLWSIARNDLGKDASSADVQRRVLALMQENPGIDPRRMRPGQQLVLPDLEADTPIDRSTVLAYNKSDQSLRQDQLVARMQARLERDSGAVLLTGTPEAGPYRLLSPSGTSSGQAVEVPFYDAMGNYAGTETQAAQSSPSMGYAQQMKNAARFVGDNIIGAAKGIDNLIPETAALAYRLSGYAIAGVASLYDKDLSDRLFSQYGRVNGRIFEYDNQTQEFAGIAAQLAGPGLVRGAIAGGAKAYELEQSLKAKINYDYRHYFSGTTVLENETTLYSYKNSAYFTEGTTFEAKNLWLTPEALPGEEAVRRLALPYPKGYDTLLTVTLPEGTKVMSPRPVWSLFGQPGGGVETRAFVPISPTMYKVGPIP